MAENPRLFENYDKGLTKKLETRLLTSGLEPEFTPNAISILKKRYFAKDEMGRVHEDTKKMFARVASNVAYPDFHYSHDEEATYESAKDFYEMMANREFMPNSPTLMNAGRTEQQLSACFVIPIEDKIESILEGVRDTGMIHKSGGGTGFSFSKLRRKNDYVSTTYGKASGPVSFIEAYDATTNAVNQGGFRRGANMGILSVEHADILEFVHAKQNERDRKYGNFNFSVAITDNFMRALERGEHYVLKSPRGEKVHDLTIKDIEIDAESVKQGLISEYERVLVVDEQKNVIFQNPLEKDIRGRILEVEKKKVGKVDEQGRITLDARSVFEEIAKFAWKNGEPGIAFMDVMNKYNPTPEVGKIESTNPCGEQPLLPYEACNLGSINLGLMIENGEINRRRLEKVVRTSVHFLDNVIDMSKFPLEQITNMVHGNRKVGLGIMGWADTLIQLGIPYNSETGVETAENIMKFIQEKGTEESERLAEQKGAFPNFEKSIYSGKKPRRNATITTIAPTGTISIISGASSGIEPLFELFYTHKDADGTIRNFENEFLIRELKKAKVDSGKVVEELKKGKSLQELEYIPKNIRDIFVVSRDISPEWHVKMQATFQRYTDNAVSKTINLPNSASVDDVMNAFLMAYKMGCKGITVYRVGSREEEVLKKVSTLERTAKVEYIKTKNRSDVLDGKTFKKKTGCGNIFVTINYQQAENGEREIFETFSTMGKAGGCAACQNEATGRLISLLERSNADPKAIATQLIGIKCDKPYGFGPKTILSCPDAVGKTIVEFLGYNVYPSSDENIDSVDFESKISIDNGKDDFLEQVKKDISSSSNGCPECGSPVVIKEGCLGGSCTNPFCGHSECS